jgi:DNA repair protein RecO (recombination protein O)
MRVQLQHAYCIHSRSYRETSQIVEMLTPEHGLVSCIRRGLKKTNGSVGLLFSPLLISWSGRGDLFTLTHVESVGAKKITVPALYIIGKYLNELILRLVPKSSPSKEVFNLYQHIVGVLDDGDNQEKLLRLFEVELLALIGHGLSLDKEIDHETPIQKDCTYRYDVGLGPVKVMQKSTAWNVIKGTTLLSLQSPLSMDSTCLLEAKRLMRGIINLHLANRPLHSREILQFMQA